jgi:hypothetical protein
MPAMIRKQIYIEPRQDELLKRLAKEKDTTEADLIRKAIDQYAHEIQAEQKRQEAWQREKAFIEEWRKEGPPLKKWKWNREELYDRQGPSGH